MEEEEIDVVNYEPDGPGNPEKIDFQCEICSWIGKSDRSLSAHRRHKHPKPPGEPEIAEEVKKARGRPKKPIALQSPIIPMDILQERVTTKQLLGGRRRPKTVVENVDESAIKTDREASRLHELGLINEGTSLGDYVRRGNSGAFPIVTEIDEEAGSMVVGEEVVIGGGEEDDSMVDPAQFPARPRAPATRKYQSDKLPERLTVGDPTGKYSCYVEDCPWKGGYRSIRMDHMRAVHPEWKKPPRFLLEKISKQGIYLDPETHVPEFPCLVAGCTWRGNYRASRSSHMKKVHPLEHAEKKRRAPGYNSTGSYKCHYPMCTWRGWSRSTRSLHLKRAHPEWRIDENESMTMIACFHCKSSFPSYPLLVQHIETHGGLGLHVDETFETKHQFSSWLQRVERLYSITFERAEPDHVPVAFSSYTLRCNCAGPRGAQLAADAKSYIYQKHNFLKRRNHQFETRTRNDCSVYLTVRDNDDLGPIHVRGCLEHTGHRFGTPLLRMSQMDRQLYADVLEWKTQKNFEFMALDAVEKLNSYEGFTMDNYSGTKPMNFIDPLDEDPQISLKKIIEQSDPSCFFAVDFGGFEKEPREFSFGYQNHHMQKLWTRFGPERTLTIDVTLVDFDDCEMTQYTAIVADDTYVPRCCLVYLTTNTETGPETVLQHLKNLDPRGPREVMCDPSQIWVNLTEKLWPNGESTVLISEWTLMDFWAAKTEQLVANEFDVFSIVSALRRMLRVEEPNQLLFHLVELFEALFECSYDRLAEFFDAQITDLEYFKRWSPVHRNSFTSHAHPTMGVASRILRFLYMCNDGFERVDQWFAHATNRIQAFNDVEVTQTFTMRPLDVPKKYYYNILEPRDQVEMHEDVGPEEILVYEEELVDGDVVVEEEVIGHEELGEEELIEEVIDDDQMLYEEMMEKDEQRGALGPMIPEEHLGIVEETVTIESSSSPTNLLHHHYQKEHLELSTPSAHPHSSRLQPEEMDDEELDEEQEPELMEHEPPRRTVRNRETTKNVIRGRKKRDRFAELRECPPEIMRAIAAHAIGYDGRRKEQRPYICAPMEAQMTRSTVPVVPTPDLRQFGVVPAPRLTPQQIALVQQQRREKRDLHWARFRQKQQLHPPQQMHHDVIDDRIHEIDDQQPCTSASLYH